MRLVEFNNLKNDMTIADNFYGINGEILARKGTLITQRYIENLQKYEIPFLYITDEYSEDIGTRCTITSATRNEATQSLKKFYEAVAANRIAEFDKRLEACKKSSEKLVDDVISEKIDIYDVFDIKLIENYKYQQAVNVVVISTIIGKAFGYGPMKLYELAMAAFFHDIGDNFIPKEILYKVDKLTDEEYATVQKHAMLGYKFAKEKLMLPMRTYLAIGQHHEKYNGKGYPFEKVGEDINEYARIIAIADVFDALSSKRRQRMALHPSEAFKMVVEGAGTLFDPKFIRLFLETVSPYPIGYTLHLPSGLTGIVIENYKGKPFNPKLKIINENGNKLIKPYELVI